MGLDCVCISAPWPARGDPDQGIAFFYPNEPYFEWTYGRTLLADEKYSAEDIAFNEKYVATSIEYILDHLQRSSGLKQRGSDRD